MGFDDDTIVRSIYTVVVFVHVICIVSLCVQEMDIGYHWELRAESYLSDPGTLASLQSHRAWRT